MAGVTGGHKLKAFLRKAARAQAGSVKSLEVGFFDSAQVSGRHAGDERRGLE